jgi:DNA polymerase III sliding clamp (beta) subunit (PCNA family)
MILTKKTLKIASKMLDCASTDVMRYQIQCLKIEKTVDGVTRMVATDGHKMAVRYIQDGTMVTRDLFLPHIEGKKHLSNLLREIKKLPDEIEIRGEDIAGQVRFEFGGAILKLETSQGVPNYPDIDAVIPNPTGFIEFALNADYIAQIAEALQDHPSHKGVIFRVSEQSAPVIVRAIGDEKTRDIGVIMPMRTNIMEAWPNEVYKELKKIEKGASYTEEQATA